MAGLDGSYYKKSKHCDRLKDAFTTFLPKDFKCRIRYTHSPPRPCDPLFSPCPGMAAEKTKLASHFLTVSVPADATIQKASEDDAQAGDHVFVFAMEVLIYSTKDLITMFVSKADSTGYLPHQRPSPIKTIATTFLWWLGTQQRRRQPTDEVKLKLSEKKLVISLFARSQSAYLFPGSADNRSKHILDDRQLIKWWARVLDPLFPKREEYQSSLEAEKSVFQGYMTVPGYQGMNEIKRFLPAYNVSSGVGAHWEPGNPLRELAKARGVPEQSPTRCLLPRFPDDPKARFMQDLDDEVGLSEDASLTVSATTNRANQPSGAWKNVVDLDRFWEGLEFRQECSSGRVVGFLWLVIGLSEEKMREEQYCAQIQPVNRGVPHRELDPPAIDPANIDLPIEQALPKSQDSQTSKHSSSRSSSTASRRRKPLSGPITSRQPRLKGGSSNLSATSNPQDPENLFTRDGSFLTADGYGRALSSLTNLDFSTLKAAAHSTGKWVAEVSGMAGLNDEGWALDVIGTAELEDLVRDGNSSGALPTNDLGSLVRKRKKVAN